MLLRRALLINESAFGYEHPSVGLSAYHLAACLHRKGRLQDAEPLYRRALAIYEKVYGSQNAETAGIMGMLADVPRLRPFRRDEPAVDDVGAGDIPE